MMNKTSKIGLPPKSLLFFFCVSFFINTCSSDEQHINPKTPLILISMDGFRWDYFEKTETPNFDEIIKGGSKSKALIPVFPTKTFPNHISIVTGLYPENHGIIANRMYDPIFDEYYYIGQGSKPVLDGKWYEGEPVWVTVEKSGLKAMTMFWPASEAEIMGYRPTEYFVYDGSIKHDDRIEQILNWIDYPADKRASFLSLYFSHTDTYGHKYGPNSDQIIEAIKEMDRTIGVLVRGLKKRELLDEVNILLVSDHGMTPTHPDSVIYLDDYIDMKTVEMVDWTPVGSLIPTKDQTSIFNKLKNSHPSMDVYNKGDAPNRYHYSKHRRIQPITLVAKDHWSISANQSGAEDDHAKGYTVGAHGYDPDYVNMRGVFVGHGPGFKDNFVGPGFSNIHLYEMMCRLLEINPAKNDGNLDSARVFLSN
jgi:predicted AlkP superfamily pyrophosphatase or phosphodiesterase